MEPYSESIATAFAQALHSLCTNERIQHIEYGKDRDDAALMWKEIDALGYANALIAEDQGGAGLALADGGRLVAAAAHAGLPHPFGATMVARALTTRAGIDPGDGCIAIARSHVATDGSIHCTDVIGAQLAQYVLTQVQDCWMMFPLNAAKLQAGSYRPHVSASLHWISASDAAFQWKAGPACLKAYSNALDAAAMASTMERVLELTIQYSNERHQFGRTISRFQAIQQELSIMAEQVFSARFAATLATHSAGLDPDPLLALSAKLRNNEAATIVASLAHSTFGAIGITEEHILGVFTARLHEWRSSADTEVACAESLGTAVLESGSRLSDFVRNSLMPIMTTED